MGVFCSVPGGERGVAEVGERFYLFTIESPAGGPFWAPSLLLEDGAVCLEMSLLVSPKRPFSHNYGHILCI